MKTNSALRNTIFQYKNMTIKILGLTVGVGKAVTRKDSVSNTVVLVLQMYLRVVGLMTFQKIKCEKCTLK